ncbi:MAG: ATP phosphoribosyltransferase [Oscillospiraceae bacterium]|nr:ATP phosphoribosyltransferase [Oscillospiraceae bacterium]
MNNIDFLSREEITALKLRQLFHERGYTRVTPGRFQEYDLFAENRSFHNISSLITFMDADGRLMALKPDVTLSIIRNTPDTPDAQRLCYADEVYRLSSEQREYKALSQVGVELIGGDSAAANTEIVALAVESLKLIGNNTALDVSHMGFVSGLFDAMELTENARKSLLEYIHAKDIRGVSETLKTLEIGEESARYITRLAELRGSARECLDNARELILNAETETAFNELSGIIKANNTVNIDFSMVSDLDYYNGPVFRGYVEGVPAAVLSGGRYDGLMRRMGKMNGAIGFAVTLNNLGRVGVQSPTTKSNSNDWLNVALPKGRLGDSARALLTGKSGEEKSSRKLIIEDAEHKFRYFLVKPSDVAIYVEHGAADIGVVGKDTLLETRPDVYELAALDIGKCIVAVAAPAGFTENTDTPLRVATKYVNIAKDYYASINRNIEIIELSGSIELAPLLGLSDVIVDIVETGGTLKANKLNVTSHVADISARLIANKASYKFKSKRIDEIVGTIV